MNRCFFFSKLTYLGQQFFTILQDKLHSDSIIRTIEARASFAQQIIELTTL